MGWVMRRHYTGSDGSECLVRSPESLANLLEAAGGLALERAGAILDARVAGTGPGA